LLSDDEIATSLLALTALQLFLAVNLHILPWLFWATHFFAVFVRMYKLICCFTIDTVMQGVLLSPQHPPDTGLL